MESIKITHCEGKVLYSRESPKSTRYTGELEESRKMLVEKMTNILLPSTAMLGFMLSTSNVVLADTSTSADDIRRGFMDILDVFTAIAEPILWFYALTACILIATKNKDTG